MVAVAYGSVLFITKYKSQVVCIKVVVTRAGRLREWSKGELRLSFVTFMVKTLTQSRLISGAAPLNPPYPPQPQPALCASSLLTICIRTTYNLVLTDGSS